MDKLEPEVERILAMSEEELHAALIAEGVDPDEYARRAREVFEEVLAKLCGPISL